MKIQGFQVPQRAHDVVETMLTYNSTFTTDYFKQRLARAGVPQTKDYLLDRVADAFLSKARREQRIKYIRGRGPHWSVLSD